MAITVQLPDPDFTAAVVIARNITLAPSPADLATQLDALIAQRANEDFPPPALKESVRAMLRKGGFKPSGRNKPASEYLAQAAREGRFPRINNLVDINNLLSLQSGLPISLLDADIVGPDPVIRYGRPGEKYVFNAAGQEIDLEGLICICGGPDKTPMGNPIKDSMVAKLKEATTNVVGVIYAPQSNPQLKELLQRFAALITQFAGASDTRIQLATGN